MIARCLLNRVNFACLKTCTKVSATRSIYSKVKSLSAECNEIEIKVPWGKVSGKLWGSENEQPILAIHGWQDNAGSFDSLAPLLLKNASILAIDLPGHGLSSWIQPGIMYSELIYMMLIERLKRYFGWKKIKLLSHSMGAQLAFYHTSTFPNETDFVIAIDALKFFEVPTSQFNQLFKRAMDGFFKLEASEDSNPSYTSSEIIERWKQNSVSNIDESVMKTLMIRGTTETSDGKFILTRDPRLKFFPFTTLFSQEHMKQCAELINCPYLYIKGKDSPYFEKEQNLYEVLNIMQNNNKDVHFTKIPGEHHLHLTNAEQVAHHINIFLEMYNK